MTIVAARRLRVVRGQSRRRRGNILHFRLRELYRLFRQRHGDGPNKQQMDAIIFQAVGCDPMGLDADTLGERIGLTLAQRSALKILTINPIDATRAEMDVFYRNKKRERDRVAARLRRERRSPTVERKFDQRYERVKLIIQQTAGSDRWWSVDDIAAAVCGARSFAGIAARAIRPRIHEVLNALANDIHIQQATATGKRSLSVRLVRWKPEVTNARSHQKTET